MTLFDVFSIRRGRSTGRGRNRSRTRPAIEPLDDRLLLSTFSGLNPGQVLHAGDAVQSPNGQFRLAMQDDGNLVEYGPHGDPLWASNTYDPGRVYYAVFEAILQNDGNLVIHEQATDGINDTLWASGTNNHPGDVLRVQDDGNVVIYQSGSPLWSTRTVGRDAGLYLTPGQAVFSPNGRFQLTLQTDGNLVEYGPYGDPLWASHTNGEPVGEAILQTDGNLVLYGPTNTDGSAHALWYSGTGGFYGDTLRVQDDGNVVIYYGAAPIWATNTAGADGGQLP